MQNKLKYIFILLNFLSVFSFAQNQNSKWYFGNYAGLDFMTTPPTSLTGSISAFRGTAIVSNFNGNLQFYTDGLTIYNQNHAVMPNGTGLLGNAFGIDQTIIAKQAGNQNLYYVFTINTSGLGGSNLGFYYSIVDMNLSAGTGFCYYKKCVCSIKCR